MYRFQTDVPVEEFNQFIKQTSFAPIQQTEAWGKLKNNWESAFCGVYRDDTLVGAALILMRKLLPGFVYAYCPRGPLMDLTDKEAVATFTEGAKQFCKSKGVYLLKIDPAVVVGKTLPDMPEEHYCDPFDAERGQAEFDVLTACGFRHKGFGKALDSATQPRYNALIPLKDREGNFLSAAQFKKNYRQKLRKYLGTFQSARGLYYEGKEPTEETVARFKKILSSTEARQNISLRSEDYFSLLAEAFGDDAFFAFEQCDVNAYLENLQKRLAKEPENQEKITQQIAEAEEIKAQRGDHLPLAALLTVYPPNDTGVRIAEYLYAGSDLSVFSSFCATLCGLFAQCHLCQDRNCDFLNLGGVPGTFDDGLFDFKNPFNPIIVEYAGEFDLPVCGWKYALMDKGLPLAKKCYSKLRKLLRK
ncbi:MAG: peptidoglycan bridge formation glycyltransferase FemA/FemB family protein [Clostridia bacterium]|nr:peptidoglycan bridge formation glycyltransferase FemA/FemB family protein [Clostridia bacterium]